MKGSLLGVALLLSRQLKTPSADEQTALRVLYFAPSFLGLSGISEAAVHTAVALGTHGGPRVSVSAVSDTAASTAIFRNGFTPLPWAEVVGRDVDAALGKLEHPRPACAAAKELSRAEASELIRKGLSHPPPTASHEGSESSSQLVCIFHGTPQERLSPEAWLNVEAALDGCRCDLAVARTVFEATDYIPWHWVNFFALFDQVWVPSAFLAPVLRDHGFAVEVVPEPVHLPPPPPPPPLASGRDGDEDEGARTNSGLSNAREAARATGRRRLGDLFGIAKETFVFVSISSFDRRKVRGWFGPRYTKPRALPCLNCPAPTRLYCPRARLRLHLSKPLKRPFRRRHQGRGEWLS